MDYNTDFVFFTDYLDSESDNKLQKDKFLLKEGERREVSILFVDVKNSTTLGSTLDPELFQSRIDNLMKRFTKCVTFYGGYVDKYLGDGLMALFGAKQATEQDTERAVLTGLRMIEQMEIYNRRMLELGEQTVLGIRIGINTGLVVVGKVGEEREGDFTVTGSAVHLAQRMEANAPEGKILLPKNVMTMVERCFNFENHGVISVKGFSEPIDTYTVQSQKAEKAQRWYRQKSIYVGRTKELGILQSKLDSITNDCKQTDSAEVLNPVIGIKADAGMGKTRLVHEFLGPIEKDITILSGTASGIVRTPFMLLRSLFESEFRIYQGESIDSKREKLTKGFQRLQHSLNLENRTRLSDAKALIEALLEIPVNDPRIKQQGNDLLLLLKSAAQVLIEAIIHYHAQEAKPIVIVFDDLHWMDELSGTILEHLFRRISMGEYRYPKCKLMMILEYRQDYQVGSILRKYPSFTEIELEALSIGEMRSFINHYVSSKDITEELVGKVVELSLGNPFYMEEWCNYYLEASESPVNDLAVPLNLNALILSRLDMLDKSIRLLLQKAAVIGQEFFVDILSWVEDRLYYPIDVSETLAQLEKQAYIMKLIGFDYSAYFFKHIITRDVAYKTLLIENRLILHKLAAEAIEALYPDRQQEFLFILADHYHKASQIDKAIYYLEKAARAATDKYSNKLAIELWQKLLTMVESKPENASECIRLAQMLLIISEIEMNIGAWDDAENSMGKAYLCLDKSPEDKFEYHRLKGLLSFRRGEMIEALDNWNSCLKHADDNRRFSIAHSYLGIWYQHHKDYSVSLEHHNHSLAFADTDRDLMQKAKTLSNIGLVHLALGDLVSAKQFFDDCLMIAEENQYLKLQSICLGNLGVLNYKMQDYTNAMSFYQRKRAIVDRIDDRAELIKVLGNIANIHRENGDHAAALELYAQVLILKEELGNKHELSITCSCIADEYQSLGKMHQAQEYIDRAIKLAEGNPQRMEQLKAKRSKMQLAYRRV